MGSCCSKADNHPFGRDSRSSFCSCFPWSNRNVPDYDYEDSEDELEFDTILAANTLYSNRLVNNKRPSFIWEQIASLFHGKRSGYLGGSQRSYQPLPTRSDAVENESDDSIFLNEADAQLLTSEQIQEITNHQLSKD